MTMANSEMAETYIERESGFYDFEASEGVAHVIVTVGPPEGRLERTLTALSAVAEAGVPVFLAKLHGNEISFAVDRDSLATVERALAGKGMTYRSRRDLAIVTVTTNTMRDLTGMMVRIADALQAAGARMYGVGDSHSSVQCLIDAQWVEPALRQLRAAFSQDNAHA